MKLLSYSELFLLVILTVCGGLLLFPRGFGHGVPEMIYFHMAGGRTTWAVIALSLVVIDILGMVYSISFLRRLFASGITGWMFFITGMEIASMQLTSMGIFYAIIALYALIYNCELSQIYHQRVIRQKLILAIAHVMDH